MRVIIPPINIAVLALTYSLYYIVQDNIYQDNPYADVVYAVYIIKYGILVTYIYTLCTTEITVQKAVSEYRYIAHTKCYIIQHGGWEEMWELYSDSPVARV